MRESVPSGFKEYFATLSQEQRADLQKLCTQIQKLLPNAESTISYGIPTFKLDGRGVVAFAAAKNHCTLHLLSKSALEVHADQLRGFTTTAAGIHFTREQPIPEDLVDTLIRARLAENEELIKKKQASRSRK